MRGANVGEVLYHLCSHFQYQQPIYLHSALYFLQLESYKLRKKPLFEEKIEARRHGAITPVFYNCHLNDMFAISCRDIDSTFSIRFTPKELVLLLKQFTNEFVKAYPIISRRSLREMVFDTKPWKDARKGLPVWDSSCREITSQMFKKGVKDKKTESILRMESF